jgi:hypothetical protein
MPQPTVTISNLISYWRTLPAGPDNPLHSYGVPSYFDLQLLGYVTGDSWLDAWCLNPFKDIDGNRSTYTATVYSSYELNLLPSAINPANLGKVNWLINQTIETEIEGFSSQYNYGEVQSAIWNLMGYKVLVNGDDINADGTVLADDVVALVNLANEHGSFVPDNAEYIGVILDPVAADGTHLQPIITMVHPASLGDYVWEDRNANGIQEAVETGINGATVNLWRDLNGSGTRDLVNELLATTITNTKDGKAGYYEFKGLTPGLEYQVEFVQPTGLIGVSPAMQGDTALDSNGVKQPSGQIYSGKIYLNPSDFNQTIDQGFYNPFGEFVSRAGLGNYVWVDSNANGLQDSDEFGVKDVTVELIGGGVDGKIGVGGDDTAYPRPLT